MSTAAGRAIALLDLVQELLCEVDSAGNVLWAGPAWSRELGLAPSALVGSHLCDLADPCDRERLALELITFSERGSVTPGFQCRMRSATGTTHWIRWSGVAGPDRLVLSGRDVTDEREPDRRRQDLMESSPDAIISIDGEDRIVEFNSSAERTFGYCREDALGRSLSELLVPTSHRAEHRAGVRRAAAGAPGQLRGQRLELSALRADGTEFPAELTITQTSTRPFRVTAFVRDLSVQHAAQRALKDSETRTTEVFDQAPVGIALVSVDPEHPGRLLRVNDALSRMLGYPKDDLLTKTFADVTHPDDIAANEALFAAVLAGHSSGYEIEKRFLRSDGTVMWGLVHGTATRDADGKTRYGIGQVQDITERKAAEDALRASEERLARTERLARIGAWEWDIARDRFSWSSGLDDIFGAFNPAHAPSQVAFLGLVHPEDRAHVRHIVDEALAGRIAKAWEYRAVRGEEVFHIYAWGEVTLGADGSPRTIQGYAQDVTGRRRAEERAEGLRRDNDRILDSAGEGIFRVDAAGCMTYMNPAAARLLGYTPTELLGRPIHDVVHRSHPEGISHRWEECPIRLTLASGDTHRVVDDFLRRRDGTFLPVEYTSAPMRDGERVTGAVIVFGDVTERREMEARLRTFAEVDPMTGLINRRRFEELVAERLTDRSTQAGALLLLDLDHFKFVNDSFGHAAGDDLIRAISVVLTERVRAGDVLARLGGDEFAVLLSGADQKEASAVAHRLAAGIEQARPSGLQIGASVGAICFSPDTATTAGDLLVSADIALYQAKEAGRGRVEFFTGQPGTSLTWVQRIREALKADRFVLHAQPIIDLATGETVQEELLLRMLDDDDTLILPAQFLPTAETFGLIGEIDRWVVSRGVALAASGRCVHINLSGRSIGSEALLEELGELLQQSGADAANLVFELTETAAIANMTRARDFAAGLRQLGCRLALDDFGTGFGSLTYLRNLPADYLKIDREFVRNLAGSPADLRVVESIVSIAASFGQRTVAEGVEDGATLELLRVAGVHLAQGYYIGRPACALPTDRGGLGPVGTKP
ncbi:MAG TPA: PAS domain S-box protein [Solirubrobacteraceae bacterium]|nr:PAS domain S-box protein [Solirubrobacteraceae bacterium]